MSSHEPKNETKPRKTKEQFPVDTDVLTILTLYVSDAAADLGRVVVMNNLETTEHSAFAEYYHGNEGLSLHDVGAFTLRADSTAGTEQHIADFVGTFPQHLKVPQPASWCRGVYTPTAARKRLYKAVDPDDSTRMIGALIEQDGQGVLQAITWYKTTNTGPIFQSTPTTLNFSLVVDKDNAPSLDPSDIGGWTWYYCQSAGACA
ncbi:MAG: hypothetical protein U0359_39875 [Byssovorax sp.]